jgi:exosortase/archaeosortase family protein
MLVVAAVLASPVAWSARGVGVVMAVVVLPLVNLTRILSLFLAGRYWPGAFHALHVDIWQPVFLVLAVALWMLWAAWAVRTRLQRAPA